MELLESVVQGILQFLHLAGLLSAQADNPLVLLLQQELEHIQQGHGIVVRVLKDSAVFLHAQAVSLVEQPVAVVTLSKASTRRSTAPSLS